MMYRVNNDDDTSLFIGCFVIIAICGIPFLILCMPGILVYSVYSAIAKKDEKTEKPN